MIKCRKNKFWLENVSNLVCSFNLIPLEGMSLADQMNALTRMVIIIFFVLILLDFNFSGIFLLLSLSFIIILYYIQKNNMERFHAEYYTPMPTTRNNPKVSDDLTNSKRFCNDDISLEGAFNNPNWMSANQKLAGTANPKTKIPPVVIAPLCDLSYWKGTNMVTFPQINEQSNIDVHRSGYHVSSCSPENGVIENYRSKNNHQKQFGMTQSHSKKGVDDEIFPYISSEYSGEVNSPLYDTQFHSKKDTKNKEFPYIIGSEYSGEINLACGYNPQQLMVSGLPNNLPSGIISREPVMKQYNENLFTQTIQPGVYTRNEINEPINSNIGISFTQQFPPKTHTKDQSTGNIKYTEHDPSIIEPAHMGIGDECYYSSEPTEYDIYDPRFTGYGTSYRSYTDNLSGQTRFYYDDVNAIRMPNYITRSHIDNQPFADHYGPLPTGFEKGNPQTANIHSLANDAFLQGALKHRTEMSERRMRKVNSEHWQRRAAPIIKNSGRMMGGLR